VPDLGLLLRRELRTAPADTSFLPGGIQSGLGPFPGHRPFEFSKRPDHHHHPSRRRCRVDRLGQATEASFGFTHAFHNRQDIPERAGQPVERPHHEHISFSALIEEPVELRPVPPSSGSLLSTKISTETRDSPFVAETIVYAHLREAGLWPDKFSISPLSRRYCFRSCRLANRIFDRNVRTRSDVIRLYQQDIPPEVPLQAFFAARPLRRLGGCDLRSKKWRQSPDGTLGNTIRRWVRCAERCSKPSSVLSCGLTAEQSNSFLVSPEVAAPKSGSLIDAWRVGFAYEKSVRFKVPPRPSRTVPKSNREPGSGVAIIVVESST
jgi:hypothetical protein